VLWIGQLAGWLEWRPIKKGESVVVSMKLRGDAGPVPQAATLQVPGEFVVETPAFRSTQSNEIAWRVKAVEQGSGVMQCNSGSDTVEKEITASASMKRVSPKRLENRFWDRVLYPAEQSLTGGGAVSEVRVDYPSRSMRFFGHEINWLVALFLASIGFALLVKRPFGVEF
jgi:hypothetical protein